MAVTKKEFIIRAFLQITNVTSGAMQFADRWICDQGWFKILTNIFPSLKDSVTINRTNVMPSYLDVVMTLMMCMKQSVSMKSY
jgi:hypothetical protein